MTTDEIIKSLRACVNGDCNECREQLGIKCYDALALLAADELERLSISLKNADSANDFLKAELRDCRNELCLKCGLYEVAYEGACDGCRWKR